MNETSDEKSLVALVPRRLCAPFGPELRLADLEDDELRNAAQVALEWQKVSAWADWWELHGATRGAEENRLYALAGRIAAAGEQIGLAYAACMELEIWRRHKPNRSREPHEGMAIRAVSELAIYFVLGAGHALANCLVQALAIKRELREALKQHFGTEFPAFSEQRKDWVSLNRNVLRKCRLVVLGEDQPISTLVRRVDTLDRDLRWRNAVNRRDEDFHRWRPQSPGLAGVAKKGVWKREGKARSFGFGGRIYSDADALPEKSARIAKAALTATSETFHEFLEHDWPLAASALGVPLFRTIEER